MRLSAASGEFQLENFQLLLELLILQGQKILFKVRNIKGIAAGFDSFTGRLCYHRL